MVNAVNAPAFLDTVQGELALFRGVAHARPAGAHRFFHVIAIRSTIRAETGQEVSIDDLWKKLGNYYDLHYFDSNVRPVLHYVSCARFSRVYSAPNKGRLIIILTSRQNSRLGSGPE